MSKDEHKLVSEVPQKCKGTLINAVADPATDNRCKPKALSLKLHPAPVPAQ